MPLIGTRAGASAVGFSHMASSILSGFNNNSTLAVAHSTTPFLTVYPFNDVTGFGTKYSNPATLPPGNGYGVTFSSDGSTIALANHQYPGLNVYPWSPSTGFGTKYTQTYNEFAYGVAFNPDKTAIVVTSQSSPYINAWPWSSGFGTKYSNPATLLTGTGLSVNFNPAGTVLAVGHDTSPFISAYAWSSGFGSKYSNPATIPIYGVTSLDFNSTGDAITFGGLLPGAYAWSSGFGTKYTNPSGFPSGAYGSAFNPAGTVVAYSQSLGGADPIIAYPWNSSTGYGTKYASPALSIPSTDINALAWNPTGTAIAVATAASPYVHAYAWYNGFASKYANPATLPTGIGRGIAFI